MLPDDAAEMKSMTHSLINHISVVSSYIELLSLTGMSEEQQEICDEMQKAARQAVGVSRSIESHFQDGEAT